MLKKIGIGIVALFGLGLAVLFGAAAQKPATFRVARSTLVNAPPHAVFVHLEDFHRWGEWSPWEKLDPNMKKSYDGPASGKGAIYAWEGNNGVGAGKMTIVDEKPDQSLSIKLEFQKPFQSTNQAEYTLTPKGAGTEVTWAMEGPNSFVGKVFSVFADMDKMLGKDFEKGLANLKSVSEAP